jgi:hypothetical protein
VKRVYAILIFLILLVNASGFYIYYAVQLTRIREEMRQALKKLPDDQLQMLTLSKGEFKESKFDENEIRFNGKMYDIARVKFSRDSVLVYGLHDNKEDDLMALLSDVVSKPLKNRNSIPPSIQQFLSLIFLAPSNEFCLSENSTEHSATWYYFSVQLATTSPVPPPPWISVL